MSAQADGSRQVSGTIDTSDYYGSVAAAANGSVFFAVRALDESGRLAPAAVPVEPYQTSPVAQAERQAEVIFAALDQSLAQLGSSVSNIVQIENYVQLKVHSNPFFKVATSKRYLGQAVPVAATAQVGSYVPQGAVAAVTGIAIIPDEASGLIKGEPPDPSGKASANRKFSELIYAGPYLYTTIFPSDRKSGLPEAARTPGWIWSGSEIGAELKWGLGELGDRLKELGATADDIVDYTVFLTDPGDLYEVDLAMAAAMPSGPPTRTVVPSKGFALPRREGAFGHEDGAPRMEMQFRIRRPEHAADKRSVAARGSGNGFQADAVELGGLLWLGSQVAAPATRGDTGTEVSEILDRLQQVAADGGSDLARALRIRAVLTRPDQAEPFFAGLRKAIPNDPPAVSVVVAPTALSTPDASLSIDAVVAS
jgi:enamine deaminase RidA (YjgF/YER057c/UK114 family)